jgi:hypothetical protein
VLRAEDHVVLNQIKAGTFATRAFLCAIARRGKAITRDEPARAKALLGALRNHPVYRAGRVIFDLMELEDLMLDGEAPEQMSGYFDAHMARVLARSLAEMHDLVMRTSANLAQAGQSEPGDGQADEGPDAEAPAAEADGNGVSGAASLPAGISAMASLFEEQAGRLHLAEEPEPDHGWPALDASDYLFDMVVLGVMRQAAWSLVH